MSEKKKEHKIIKEQFGRYLLLDHLVDGGMAKICRARYLGEQAEKIVAIKMVQPQFSQDEAFRKMFEDEVKISFGLQHPNIAQTYDYGMMNGQLYTAMEYVDGKNLKQYLDELKKRKVLFPIEISVHIISLACQGLHYAHTYTDKLTGKALNLVHRDISPHNIMLTYDGSVKVIDFGIAKAETNSDATQAGTIKGKLSYLAPEYLEGMTLDGRYDQFALGIVLWEMLCSRKLFTASNELAVLKEIQKCKIPTPSSINPTVPKELDQIVLKALSKDRNQRYANMDEFNRALTKFLYSTYENFNPSDLGKFATTLFKKEIEEDRRLMREFGKIDVTPYLENLKKGVVKTTSGSDGASEAGDNTPLIKKAEVFDFDLDAEANGGLSIEGVKDTKTSKTKNKAKINISRTSTNIKLKRPSLSSRSAVPKPSNDKTATRNFNLKEIVQEGKKVKSRTQTKTKNRIKNSGGQTTGRSSSMLKIASFVIVCTLLTSGIYWGFKGPSKSQIANNTEPTKHSLEDVQREPSSADRPLKTMGTIHLKNYESLKHEVYINGKPVDISLGEVEVPLNQKIVLRVEQKDHHNFVKQLKVTKKHSLVEIEIPEMEEDQYGYLMMSDKHCVSGVLKFELDGEKREEPLPLRSRNGIAIPVGVLKVTLLRAGDLVGTTKEIRVNQADDVIDICDKFMW